MNLNHRMSILWSVDYPSTAGPDGSEIGPWLSCGLMLLKIFFIWYKSDSAPYGLQVLFDVICSEKLQKTQKLLIAPLNISAEISSS